MNTSKMKEMIIFIIVVFTAMTVRADSVRGWTSIEVTKQSGDYPFTMGPSQYFGDTLHVDLYCAGANTLPAGITVTDHSGDVFTQVVTNSIFSRWVSQTVKQAIDPVIVVHFPSPTTCLIYAEEIKPDTLEASAGPGGSMRDQYGHTWTLGASQYPQGYAIFVNGVYTGGIGQVVLNSQGLVWTIANGQWYYFAGLNNWVPITGTPNMTGYEFAAPYYGLGHYTDSYGDVFGFTTRSGTSNAYQVSVNGINTPGAGYLLARSYGVYTTLLGTDQRWYFFTGTGWAYIGAYPTLGDLMILSKTSRLATSIK